MRRLASLLVVVCLAGCGNESQLVLIDDLPADLYASPTPAPTAGAVSRTSVFFVREGRLVSVLRLPTASRTPAESALSDLLLGPTPEEMGAGLSSAIPPGAGLLGVSVDGDTASIDLSREFEASADQPVVVLRLAQVVYTLTALPRVERVRFLIDGDAVPVVGDDGRLREGAVTRSDYAAVGPA